MSRPLLGAAAVAALLGAACAGGRVPTPAPLPEPAVQDRTAAATPVRRPPVLPPQAAMLMGLMPRRSVGIDQFLAANPSADGRGVLIAILDSGVDVALPGLAHTTTGARKLLDARDLSGEGRILLEPVEPAGDTVVTRGVALTGFGRVRALAVPPYYAGVLAERPLGALPAADLNGDGDAADRMGLIVARASDGWVVLTDTDGDGSLAGEPAVHDYAVAAEHFAYGPVTLAANFGPGDGPPALSLFFDTSGHGSHVAGIAAGHRLFDVPGFDGAAPGAQVLALKIANDARGGVSVSGSMLEALTFAQRFAAARGLPLVVNLSFGVGNEDAAGIATIDSIVDAFALAHPDVPVVISAGNDGPGISTIGFPGSAEFALSACALFPGVFAAPPEPGSRQPEDVLGWWSARGGEHAKPDLCVPGVAFSNVPAWHTGEEVSGGTSMAAPMLSGVVALLQSAQSQDGKPAQAFELARALAATARPLPGATVVEQGAGVPDVGRALRWLRAGHRAGRLSIRALPDGENRGHTAAFRPRGLAAADTAQRFTITSVGGQPFARLLLRPDAPWLRAAAEVEFDGAPATVTVRYDRSQLAGPGLYVGTVWAIPATDTAAGAAFGLINTVVVPQPLTAPYTLRKYLKPGRVEHLFFDVPEHAPGVSFRLSLRDSEQHANVYLFEPGGRPAREHPNTELGAEYDPEVDILVRGEDVVPGVYELAIAAPPTAPVTFDLTAALPSLGLAVDQHGATVETASDRAVEARATSAVIGATRQYTVGASGTVGRRVTARVPTWARELVVDVELPERLWTRVTDFALTVWDSAGAFVAEQPLNYALSRYSIPVDTLAGRLLEVELFPAFALPDDSATWSASVNLSFIAPRPLSAREDRKVVVEADRPAALPTPPVPAGVSLPDGFVPLVEATARPEDGTPTARRGAAGPGGPGATR